VYNTQILYAYQTTARAVNMTLMKKSTKNQHKQESYIHLHFPSLTVHNPLLHFTFLTLDHQHRYQQNTNQSAPITADTNNYINLSKTVIMLPPTISTTTPTLPRPYMLSDIALHAQRISASLPPDDWGDETPAPRLERQPSGVFDIASYSTLRDTNSADCRSKRCRTQEDMEDTWLARMWRRMCGCVERRNEG
jgi:hypothetical protein